MLDRLELADRPAELFADLGVLRGSVGGPTSDSDSLCREQRGDDRPPGGRCQIRQQCVCSDLNAVGPYVRDRVQWVHRTQDLDLQRSGLKLGGVDHRPLDPAVEGDRQHQDVGLRGTRNRPGFPADREGVAVPGGGQLRLQRIGGDGVAGRQSAQHRGTRVVRRD